MEDRDRILQETTGLAAGVIGGAIILVVGKLLFSNSVVPINKGDWVQTNYDPAALTVFLISTVFAIIWYLITCNWWLKYEPKQSTLATSIWVLLFVVPILSFVIALFYWGKDGDADLGLSAFLALLIALGLAMLFSYWGATALSTPKNMSSVIPLASLFRR
jgi:hypothetical protein